MSLSEDTQARQVLVGSFIPHDDRSMSLQIWPSSRSASNCETMMGRSALVAGLFLLGERPRNLVALKSILTSR